MPAVSNDKLAVRTLAVLAGITAMLGGPVNPAIAAPPPVEAAALKAKTQQNLKGREGSGHWLEVELRNEMRRDGFTFGAAAHVRIFKNENALEIWMDKNGRYERFKTLKICKWSGKLGPKFQEGDKQSPEGVYSVTRRQMLSRTKNHRAINLNYPNAYDQRLARTGSALQIHGGCGSIGCYAMTDRGIEEIYRILDAAFKNGQKRVAVHIFPFRLTDKALTARKDHKALPFWSMLKPIYASFRKTRTLPGVRVCGTRYVAPGDALKPPEKCVPVWHGSKPVRTASASSKGTVKSKPAAPPITVRCNLNLPSCKKWLAQKRRVLARKGIRAGGIRRAGLGARVRSTRIGLGGVVTEAVSRRIAAREARRRRLRN